MEADPGTDPEAVASRVPQLDGDRSAATAVDEKDDRTEDRPGYDVQVAVPVEIQSHVGTRRQVKGQAHLIRGVPETTASSEIV